MFIFVLYLYVGPPEFMGSEHLCFLELTFFLIAQSISVSKFSVIQNLSPQMNLGSKITDSQIAKRIFKL